MKPYEIAGWRPMRQLCRERGVERRRMLLHLRRLDAGTGRILMMSAGKWMVNVRRLDAQAGPTRQRIDETLEDVSLRVEDLEDGLRTLERRVAALERGRAAPGGDGAKAADRSGGPR